MGATAAPPSEAKDRDKMTTLERVAEKRNMSDKQVRDYLASDEFAQHGSKSLKGNATRLLKLLSGGTKKNVTMEDRELLRGALRAMESAQHSSGERHEATHALVTSKAYGYDPEAGGDEADYGAQKAAPSATAGEGEPDEDDEDEEEEPEQDEQ